MSNEAITSLLKESRRFDPPAEFAAKARIGSARGLRPALPREHRRPRGLLAPRDRRISSSARPGPRRSSGISRTRSGSPARRSTSPRAASIATSPPRRGTARRSSGRVSSARPARSRTRSSTARWCSSPTRMRAHGIAKGDRVAIYMGMVPEVAVAMLACARLGAVHTVVFGGFAADALRDRIHDCQAKMVITQDGGYRRGNVLSLKEHGRQGARAAAVEERREGHRLPAPRPRALPRADEGGARSLVARGASPRRRAPRRGDGRRGRAPALHPLHLGLDGQAEGRAPHHRGLPRRRARHDQVRLRSRARTTSTGARPTSAGSRATATSCTARSPTARRA